MEDAAVVEVGTKLDSNQPTMSPPNSLGHRQTDKKGSAVDFWQTLPLARLWLGAQAFISHAVASLKKKPIPLITPVMIDFSGRGHTSNQLLRYLHQ